jgi:hypothetical protein
MEVPATSPIEAKLTLDELLQSHIEQISDGRGFLPCGLLEKIICKDTIERVLERHSGLVAPDQLEDVATRISTSFRVVFAILVIIDKLGCLHEFLDPTTGVSDSNLPLEKAEREDARNLYHLRKKYAPRSELNCFVGWTHHDLLCFYERQWSFLVPSFSLDRNGSAQHYNLDSKTILPFLEGPLWNAGIDDQPEMGLGGYGIVRQGRMHPAHHDFQQTIPHVSYSFASAN